MSDRRIPLRIPFKPMPPRSTRVLLNIGEGSVPSNIVPSPKRPTLRQTVTHVAPAGTSSSVTAIAASVEPRSIQPTHAPRPSAAETLKPLELTIPNIHAYLPEKRKTSTPNTTGRRRSRVSNILGRPAPPKERENQSHVRNLFRRTTSRNGVSSITTPTKHPRKTRKHRRHG